ncbi:MAG: FG-GAP-like repeat-containing protein [Flavobacterium sp.]
MKKITFLILLIGIFQNALIAQSSCENALTITAGNYTYGIINGAQATLVCAGAEVADNALWYKYTTSTAYMLTVTTDLPQNQGRDPRFQVYTGACGSLVCYAGDDDDGDAYLAVDSFLVQPNITYYIAFDNQWGNDANNVDFQLIEDEYVAPPQPLIGFTNVSRTLNGQYKLGVVDMNGDFADDIVSISNGNIQIHFSDGNNDFTTQNFTVPNVNNGFLPSWSLAAADYNADGFTDLLYGGGNGVAFMKSINNGTAFEPFINPSYVFSQRSNFVDLNNDGNLDAFVCHDVAPNVFFMNDGEGNLSFNQGGIGDYPTGGNYGSIWVDYDNDGDQDLFIAKCRGGSVNGANVNEMHRNDGDGIFTDVSASSGLQDPIQTWSSAWGDFDNDGDMDVLVGASSNSDGMHKLMRNNGDGTFTDITSGTGLESFLGLGIEYVAQDFNNDGFIDVFCGESSTILFNDGDMTFTVFPTNAAAGALGDLNNDGFWDVLNGNTMKINNGNDNNWIKIHLQGVESNRNGIGARIEIYGDFGKQIRDVRSGDGFRFMSSLNPHFGIGSATVIDSIVIKWPSGLVETIEEPTINQPLFVIEGATLSNDVVKNQDFNIYPNPVKDLVTITSNISFVNVRIFDMNGKMVYINQNTNNQFALQSLQKGTYLLQLEDVNGKKYSQKLIKD